MRNDVCTIRIRYRWTGVRVYMLASSALLSACAAGAPKILPTESTYPVGKVQETTTILQLGLPVYSTNLKVTSATDPNVDEEIRYSPGQTVLSSSFKGTTEGDSALHEVWITPGGRVRSDERSLLDQIDVKGRETCGADYRHFHTKYFYGSEATLSWMQIKTPAVRVEFRCVANRQSIGSKDGELLEKWAANEESRYFDLFVYEFPTPTTVIVDALKAYAARNTWKIEQRSDLPADSPLQMMALNSQVRYSFGMPYVEKAYVAVSDTGSSTRMTVLFMHYALAHHERGVQGAGTQQPGFDWGLRPTRRDFTFSRASIFVDKVLASVGK